MESFYRRVKLHAFFTDPNKGFIDPGSEADDDPFMKYKWKTSNWTRSSNPACVERFIERCKDEIKLIDLMSNNKASNISLSDSKALQALKKREDVIVKPSDKGGAIVVWQKELYSNEADRQLSDETFYRKKDSDRMLHNWKIVETTVSEEILVRHLPGSASALIPSEVRCSCFYLLPKKHKTRCTRLTCCFCL